MDSFKLLAEFAKNTYPELANEDDSLVASYMVDTYPDQFKREDFDWTTIQPEPAPSPTAPPTATEAQVPAPPQAIGATPPPQAQLEVQPEAGPAVDPMAQPTMEPLAVPGFETTVQAATDVAPDLPPDYLPTPVASKDFEPSKNEKALTDYAAVRKAEEQEWIDKKMPVLQATAETYRKAGKEFNIEDAKKSAQLAADKKLLDKLVNDATGVFENNMFGKMNIGTIKKALSGLSFGGIKNFTSTLDEVDLYLATMPEWLYKEPEKEEEVAKDDSVVDFQAAEPSSTDAAVGLPEDFLPYAKEFTPGDLRKEKQERVMADRRKKIRLLKKLNSLRGFLAETAGALPLFELASVVGVAPTTLAGKMVRSGTVFGGMTAGRGAVDPEVDVSMADVATSFFTGAVLPVLSKIPGINISKGLEKVKAVQKVGRFQSLEGLSPEIIKQLPTIQKQAAQLGGQGAAAFSLSLAAEYTRLKLGGRNIGDLTPEEQKEIITGAAMLGAFHVWGEIGKIGAGREELKRIKKTKIVPESVSPRKDAAQSYSKEAGFKSTAKRGKTIPKEASNAFEVETKKQKAIEKKIPLPDITGKPPTTVSETVTEKSPEEIESLVDEASNIEDLKDGDTTDEEKAMQESNKLYEKLMSKRTESFGEPQTKEDILDGDIRFRALLEKENVAPQMKKGMEYLLEQTRDGVMLDENGVGRQNRVAYDATIDEMYQYIAKFGDGSILVADIGNVGWQTNTIGHEGMNVVMKMVANTLEKNAKAENIPYSQFRQGGDEIGLAAYADKTTLDRIGKKTRADMQAWMNENTIQDLINFAKKEGVEIKVGENVDKSMIIADAVHHKHGINTGFGYIDYGVASTKDVDNRSALVALADGKAEVMKKKRLDKNQKGEYIIDREGNYGKRDGKKTRNRGNESKTSVSKILDTSRQGITGNGKKSLEGKSGQRQEDLELYKTYLKDQLDSGEITQDDYDSKLIVAEVKPESIKKIVDKIKKESAPKEYKTLKALEKDVGEDEIKQLPSGEQYYHLKSLKEKYSGLEISLSSLAEHAGKSELQFKQSNPLSQFARKNARDIDVVAKDDYGFDDPQELIDELQSIPTKKELKAHQDQLLKEYGELVSEEDKRENVKTRREKERREISEEGREIGKPPKGQEERRSGDDTRKTLGKRAGDDAFDFDDDYNPTEDIKKAENTTIEKTEEELDAEIKVFEKDDFQKLLIEFDGDKATRIKAVEKLIYDYSRQLRMQDETHNRVATLIKEAKTLNDYKKAISIMKGVKERKVTSRARKRVDNVISKERTRLKKQQTKGKSNIDYETNVQISGYLDAVEGSFEQKQAKLQKMLNKMMTEDFDATPSDIAIMNALSMPSTKLMSYNEANEVIDYIKALKSNAKKENIRARILTKKAEYSAKEVEKNTRNKKIKVREHKQKKPTLYSEGVYQHLSPETIIEDLTGTEGSSMLKRSVFDQVYDSYVEKAKAKKRALAEFEEIYKDVDLKNIKKKKFKIQAAGKPFKFSINNGMFYYANNQNQENRAYLIATVLDLMEAKPNKEGMFTNDEVVEALSIIDRVIEKLPENYKKAVDKQVSYNDNVVYDRVNKEFKKEHMVDMDKVKNYFRIMNTSASGGAQGIYSDLMGRRDVKTQMAVSKDFTKPRTGNTTAFKDADYLGNVVKTMDDVVQYTSYNTTIRNVKAVLGNKHVSKAIQDFNPSAQKALLTWIDDVARGKISSADAWVDKAVIGIVDNIAVSYLGLNPTTILKQIPSFVTGMGALDNKWSITGGILEYVKNPIAAARFVLGKSQMMEERSGKMMPILQEAYESSEMKRIIGKMGLHSVKDKVMALIGVADRQVTTTLWISRYIEVLNSGKNEAFAIKKADELIRKTQPMGALEFQPGAYRQKGMTRSLYRFTNQLSKTFNKVYLATGKGKTASERLNTLVYYLLGPSFFMALIGAGFNLKKFLDEPEEIARAVGKQTVGAIPFVNYATDNIIVKVGNVIRKKQLKKPKNTRYVAEMSVIPVDYMIEWGRAIQSADFDKEVELMMMAAGMPVSAYKKYKRGIESGSVARAVFGAESQKDYSRSAGVEAILKSNKESAERKKEAMKWIKSNMKEWRSYKAKSQKEKREKNLRKKEAKK